MYLSFNIDNIYKYTDMLYMYVSYINMHVCIYIYIWMLYVIQQCVLCT